MNYKTKLTIEVTSKSSTNLITDLLNDKDAIDNLIMIKKTKSFRCDFVSATW